MNLAAAILILGATGHAERSMESTDSIEGIVGQCLGGLLSDAGQAYLGATAGRNDFGSRISLDSFPQLTIDGQPREGLRAWGEAGCRVARYVINTEATGRVEYSYSLQVRAYTVRRHTEIRDGRVMLTTDAWWTEVVQVTRRISRRVPIHVTITISASERSGPATVLVGTAIGRADTREFRCGLVRRIAERQASDTLRVQLPAVLRTIERGGRKFYAGGTEIAGLLDRIHLGIEIGGIIRRLRR